ncbi:MAG TPA: hypothetical protein VF936_03690 [Burkholderiales bacterium]
MLSGAERVIAASAVVALPLAGLLWISGAIGFPLALAAMIVLALVVLSTGLLALRAVDGADMPAPAAWVLGVFVTMLSVYALVEAFHLLAFTAFAIWAAVVAGLGFIVRRRAGPGRPMQATELVALLACGAVTVLWCREIAAAPQVLAREGLLPAWIDFLIHGGGISQLGDPRAAGRGSIEMVDFPASPYHYASYILPAAFAVPLDLPGLPLATSVWLPLGFFTMCAGAYALGAALAGPAGAVAAVAALTLLPDAASYGLRNGMFGFQWNLLGTPGAPYAVGFCLLSIAFLQRWLQEGKLRPLLASAVLVAGTALVRAHVFALAFPAVLASAAMATSLVRRRRLVSFALAAAAFLLFVAGFYAMVTDARPALEESLELLHDRMEPTGYTGWYMQVLKSRGSHVAVPFGIALAYVASLGALVVLYPVSVWLMRRSGRLAAIDLVPAAFLACYLLLMIAAPVPTHGDATELTHRPFVVLYAVIAIWTAAGFVSCMVPQSDRAARRAWLALLLLGGLALPVLWPQTSTLGRVPRFQWGWQYTPYRVEDGLVQAAAFLRARSHPGDVFAAQDVKLGWVATDSATELASLTGMPAYLSRPFIHLGRGSRSEQVARERYGALKRIEGEEDAAAAARRLRELGIQWYVVVGVGSEGPRWDRGRRHAAFAAGRVSVYSAK